MAGRDPSATAPLGAPRVPGALMAAEIAEQPALWRAFLPAVGDALRAAADHIARAEPELFALVARGSSDHAAMYGQYLFHAVLGVPTMLTTPSSYSAYGARLRYPRTVAIAVSQSGSSPDLLAAVSGMREAGVPAIGITNTPASPLAELASALVPLHAGQERSVAATKTYTLSLVAFAALAAVIRGEDPAGLEEAIDDVSTRAGELLALAEDWADRLIGDGLPWDRVVVAGRGLSMASAKEAALKLMETNALAASGWSAADAIHGPLGQVVESTRVFALNRASAGRESVDRLVETARRRGGRVCLVGSGGDGEASFDLGAGNLDTRWLPLLEILPFQVLAHRLAVARGLDPDRPDGLSKVTLTT